MEDPLVSILAILLSVSIIWYFLKLSRKVNGGPPEPSGSWSFIGHLPLLAGRLPPHLVLGDLADKYGPIFTIKLGVHRALVISSSEMARECLSTNDKAFASRPKSLTTEIMGYNYAIIGFAPYGPYWRQIRRVLSLELLSSFRLEKLRHVRELGVSEAIQALYNKWVTNKDMSNLKLLFDLQGFFDTITMNNILKIIVGRRYIEYEEESDTAGDDGRFWRDALREFMDLAGKVSVSDALLFLRFLDLGGTEKAMKRVMQEFDNVLQGWLDEHKEKGKGRLPSNSMKLSESTDLDFMDLMLSALDGRELEFSDRNVDTISKATCLALVLAASETTALTLTWTISLLLNNLDGLKKVKDELDIRIYRDRKVEESDINNLEYLQAVVKESFRLYPALPLSLPHESMEDCTIGGYHVPAGTRLFVMLRYGARGYFEKVEMLIGDAHDSTVSKTELI